jgi:hypothetical protein
MPQIVVFPNNHFCELQLVELTGGSPRVHAMRSPALHWECSMDQPLDVFRIVPEGVRWMGSAESLEAAKALIKAKSAQQPGDFLSCQPCDRLENGNQGSGAA